MITRRELLASASAAAAVASLASIAGPAAAQSKKSIVLASMGPVTGNWDPTSHTTLGQSNFEKFVFSHLTRCQMEESAPR